MDLMARVNLGACSSAAIWGSQSFFYGCRAGAEKLEPGVHKGNVPSRGVPLCKKGGF